MHKTEKRICPSILDTKLHMYTTCIFHRSAISGQWPNPTNWKQTSRTPLPTRHDPSICVVFTSYLNCPYNEMKPKQNSFKTVSTLFRNSFSACLQNISRQLTSRTFRPTSRLRSEPWASPSGRSLQAPTSKASRTSAVLRANHAGTRSVTTWETVCWLGPECNMECNSLQQSCTTFATNHFFEFHILRPYCVMESLQCDRRRVRG